MYLCPGATSALSINVDMPAVPSEAYREPLPTSATCAGLQAFLAVARHTSPAFRQCLRLTSTLCDPVSLPSLCVSKPLFLKYKPPHPKETIQTGSY